MKAVGESTGGMRTKTRWLNRPKAQPSLFLCCLLSLLWTASGLCDDSSADALLSKLSVPVRTELKQYQDKMYKIVGDQWYAHVNQNMTLLEVGEIKTKFYVRSNGTIDQFSSTVTSGNVGVLQMISEKAVMAASGAVAPFSDGMKRELGDGYWDDITFTITPEEKLPYSSGVLSTIGNSVSAGTSKEDEKALDHYGTLTTSDGTTYSKVVVKSHDPAAIEIVHSSGAARIPFEKLPKEIQAKYGYDPKKADDFLKIEKPIDDVVGPQWYALVNQRRAELSIGTVKIAFVVHPDGSVEEPKGTSLKGETDKLMALSIEVVKGAAPLKSIPALSTRTEPYPMEITFTLY